VASAGGLISLLAGFVSLFLSFIGGSLISLSLSFLSFGLLVVRYFLFFRGVTCHSLTPLKKKEKTNCINIPLLTLV
jgi:hypothetical protein